MTAILYKLPFSESAETIHFGQHSVTLQPNQIMVWVTICRKGPVPFNPAVQVIPAILDTGFNENFAIREEQLTAWAGLISQSFQKLHSGQIQRGAADWRAANVWLHRNVANSRDRASQQPLRLELDEGIIVFKPPSQGDEIRPRLPLLGTRALRRNDACLSIDFRTCRVNLIRPRLFFIGWGL